MLRVLVRELAAYRSTNNSTTLITLYIPSSTRYSDVTKMITSEISKTPNIKSRVTRQCVQAALQSVLSQLKGINKFPRNEMVLLAGDTPEKFVNVAIEPSRSIDRFFYRCDNLFHV